MLLSLRGLYWILTEFYRVFEVKKGGGWRPVVTYGRLTSAESKACFHMYISLVNHVGGSGAGFHHYTAALLAIIFSFYHSHCIIVLSLFKSLGHTGYGLVLPSVSVSFTGSF